MRGCNYSLFCLVSYGIQRDTGNGIVLSFCCLNSKQVQVQVQVYVTTYSVGSRLLNGEIHQINSNNFLK